MQRSSFINGYAEGRLLSWACGIVSGRGRCQVSPVKLLNLRIVDAQRFQDEKKQLEEWHEKNMRAERDLFMTSKSQS